jgi:FKBP-type peptidyl-prolyl cis-trans isomerase FkpA
MKQLKIIVLAIVCIGFFTKAQSQDFLEKDGMKYKIYPASKPGQKPEIGQTALVDLVFYSDQDQPVFNSLDKKEPIPIPISASQFKGDLMEGLQMLGVGDSGIFLIKSDSIIKMTRNANNMKPGTYLRYIIKLHSIYDAKAQQMADEQIIKEYLKKNKIKGAKHTATGMYYVITEKGKGDLPKNGQTVTAHYTGKFLSGLVFDSDKGAGFSFELGSHRVIAGWEEAFALLKKGTKATIYLPSTLAYGLSGGGPIPANAVLIFDVELVDVK